MVGLELQGGGDLHLDEILHSSFYEAFGEIQVKSHYLSFR